MSKNAVLAALTACLLVFSAIAYGVYINMSSHAHVAAVRQNIDAARQTASVSRRDMVPIVRTALQLEPVWNTDIYSSGDGRLEQLLVKPGDKVAAGALIAVLEGRELAAQIKQAQGSIMSARAALEQAESELSKALLLVQKDAISVVQLESARSKRDSAAGQLTSSEGSLEALQVRADHTRIYAPRDGVITKQYVEPGGMARMGLALVNLADTTKLQTLIPLDGNSLSVWQLQTKAIVTVSGVDGEMPAKVNAIKGGPSLPAGFFLMELTIDNSQDKLHPGAYSMVEVKGPVIANVLAVPEQSVLTRDSQKFVHVQQAGQFILRPVQIGYSGGGWTMILTGLQEGERIAVNGQEGWTP